MKSDELERYFKAHSQDLAALAAQVGKSFQEMRAIIEAVTQSFSYSEAAIRRMTERLNDLYLPSASPPSLPTRRNGRNNPAPWSYQVVKVAKPAAAKRSRPRIVRKINP